MDKKDKPLTDWLYREEIMAMADLVNNAEKYMHAMLSREDRQTVGYIKPVHVTGVQVLRNDNGIRHIEIYFEGGIT